MQCTYTKDIMQCTCTKDIMQCTCTKDIMQCTCTKYVQFSRKYWRGIKFGGLAVCEQTAELKSGNFYSCVIILYRNVKTAKLTLSRSCAITLRIRAWACIYWE